MKIVSLIMLVSASIFLVACGGEESAPPPTPASTVQEESAGSAVPMPVESEVEEYVSEPSKDEFTPLPTPPEDDSHQPQGEAEEAPPFE